jgi:uncharacterized membrane protein
MGYKAIIGLSEIVVGVLLLIPTFDVARTFHRLTAEELREDPGDWTVAFVSRQLPQLVHSRLPVGMVLIALGLLKLVAAGAMWEGKEWGRYLLAVVVVAALPLDMRQAIIQPTLGHFVIVLLNGLIAVLLLKVLRARPERPTIEP